jgi:hypothetical protein
MIFKKFTDILGLSKPTPSDIDIVTKNVKSEIEDAPKDSSPNSDSQSKVEELVTNKKKLFEWEIEVENEKIPEKYKSPLIIVGVLLLLFAILTQDFIFVILILSLVFLYNVSSSAPKKTYKYILYETGFEYLTNFYSWKQVQLYFFFPGKEIIGVDTVDVYPGRFYFYFYPQDRQKIDEILINYVNKSMKLPTNFIDRAIDKVKPYLNLKD